MEDPSRAYALESSSVSVPYRSLSPEYRTVTRIAPGDGEATINPRIGSPLLAIPTYEKRIATLQSFFAFPFYEQVRDHLELPRISHYFLNRAGEKLANLDGLYGITTFDIIANHDPRPWRCLDLGAAPGAWTQYLQYRLPRCFTYVMSLHPTKGGLPLAEDSLDQDRLSILGDDDLRTDSLKVIDYLREREGEIDLIVGDAASGETDRAETAQQRLLLGELVIALTSGKIGSHLVIKIFGAVQLPTLHLLWIIGQCYEEVYLSKPVTSRGVNEELYVVAKHLTSHREKWQPIVTTWYTQTTDDYESFLENVDLSSIITIVTAYRKMMVAASVEVVNAMKEFVNHHQQLTAIPSPRYLPPRLLHGWVIPS